MKSLTRASRNQKVPILLLKEGYSDRIYWIYRIYMIGTIFQIPGQTFFMTPGRI